MLGKLEIPKEAGAAGAEKERERAQQEIRLEREAGEAG